MDKMATDASWIKGYLKRAGEKGKEELARTEVLIDTPCFDCHISMRYHEIEDGKKVCPN